MFLQKWLDWTTVAQSTSNKNGAGKNGENEPTMGYLSRQQPDQPHKIIQQMIAYLTIFVLQPK
jgi:hypothetical protein